MHSRAEVRAAGGAAAWCASAGILTARGAQGSVGKETAWLGRADTLEVDNLVRRRAIRLARARVLSKHRNIVCRPPCL